MRQFSRMLGAMMLLVVCQGCSVYMAGNQPAKVDVTSLEAGGIPRDLVIAKLGVPTSSTRNDNGTRTDIYEFYPGSASGWKVGRATFHAVADVMTIGLWEVVGTPTEMAVKGDKVIGRALFDKNDILKEFVVPTMAKQPKQEASKTPGPDQ